MTYPTSLPSHSPLPPSLHPSLDLSHTSRRQAFKTKTKSGAGSKCRWEESVIFHYLTFMRNCSLNRVHCEQPNSPHGRSTHSLSLTHTHTRHTQKNALPPCILKRAHAIACTMRTHACTLVHARCASVRACACIVFVRAHIHSTRIPHHTDSYGARHAVTGRHV